MRRESGQIPFIDSCLTRQEFLGVLIDLVTNGARGSLFWHVAYRAWRFKTEVLPFRTRPIYVNTYFIRRPAAEYATQKPYGNLTRLSPSRESLAGETSEFRPKQTKAACVNRFHLSLWASMAVSMITSSIITSFQPPLSTIYAYGGRYTHSPSISQDERAVTLHILANIPERSSSAADLPSSPRQFTRQAQLAFSLSAIEPGVEGHHWYWFAHAWSTLPWRLFLSVLVLFI